MGFLDALFGGGKKLKGPAPDRIFAMVTAQITLETSLNLKHKNAAGIVFQPLATGDFQQIVRDTEALLRSAAEDTGTQVETREDNHGYRWVVLRDQDFDDLVQAINVVSTELTAGGYGDRLLAAVFAFQDERGKYYPFVPAPGEQARSNEREFQLKAQLENELPMEPELERWFPLWDVPL